MTTLLEIKEQLPINADCFFEDKHYIVNKVRFSLDSDIDIVKTQLEKNKQVCFPDWKAVSHALRAGYQARSIFKNNTFSYPLAETVYLMDVKMGNKDWTTDVQPELEALVNEVDQLSAKSDFPEKVDRKYWDNWLYQKHLQIVKDSI